MILTAPADGPFVLSTYPRAAGEPLAGDPIGNRCVPGLPYCDQGEWRWTVEPDFPHVGLAGRPDTLAARCWRILLYSCAWHDGSTYHLPDPIILGPRKGPPGHPTTSPYRTCCWDYGGNPIYSHNKLGEPIYYGPADITNPASGTLTGDRLFGLIRAAYGACCPAGPAAFLSQVPAEMYHDLRVTLVSWYMRMGKILEPGSGVPIYVDTEVTDITINRYDATPRSA